MSCYTRLTDDVAANCAADMIAGIGDVLYFINKDDIASFTLNDTNDNIVEGITLKTESPTLRGFTLTGQRYSNEFENTLVKGRFINGWEQKIVTRIFDNDPTVKERISELENGRFVIIVKNNYANATGNSVYELLGYTVGLEMSECVRNPQDADTKGGWVCTFTTNEINKENYPAKTFFITSLAATEAALAALIA